MDGKTPEEIAQAIAQKWFMDAPYMYHDEARAVIAAIRDAYERAASLIDGLVAKEEPSVGQISGADVGKYGALLLEEAAAHIRALKGEGRDGR